MIADRPAGGLAASDTGFQRKTTFRSALEAGVIGLCFICAFITVGTTLGIIVVLGKETVLFFRDGVSIGEFLTGTEWAPTFTPAKFGVLPLVTGTLMITVGSGLIAIPLGLASAIYLSEYASPTFRMIVKPALELLAGIPTVVYGYLALFHVTPILQRFFPDTEVFNAASGAIVVGIMILPLVTSLCDDAISAVPKALKEGALALGATKSEVIRQVLVRAAVSGVVAAFILALSRAVGETMAVTLAAGQSPKMTLDPQESIQTMTAFIVQISKGDTPAGSTAYLTLFAVGSLLFLMTLGLNMIARRVVKRFGWKGE